MGCTISDEQLWSWVDRQAAELDEHLAACERCRERAVQLRRDMRQLAVASALPDRRLPAQIGPYRIHRLIGEGGQGLVYEAEQQTPRRRVALKVLKSGTGRRTHDVRLFEREVESLARLRHPAIAAIYEAGCTEDGRNYFAMELIDGLPLNSFVRQRELTLHERLQLFRRICEPVTYAHQRGVIHRDLKPSNVLVNADGGPHVLDFGLARTMDSEITLTATSGDVGRVLGTLPYLSPEQAGGAVSEIDVRSDAYSLGVLLYELLTDRLPHEVSRRLPHEALRVIREEPPRRPSSIRSALRGDLETIILKALEKEPARRYQSVSALAEDIQRYLDGEPILARRPSASYQIRKLVARHKAPFAFAAAVMLLVAGFGVLSTIQAARERAARTRADREAERAKEAADRAQRTRAFLEELLLAADPRWTAGEMTVRDLLAEAERRIDADYSEDPALESDLRTILGRAYQRFGISARALPQFRAALRIREALYAPTDRSVAEACCNLAPLLLGRNRFAEAAELYERALEIRRAALPDDHPDVLATMTSIAQVRQMEGNFTAAERLFRSVLETTRRKVDAPGPAVAEAADHLAALLVEQGEFAEAEALLQEALAMRLQVYGERHKQIAHNLHELGHLYHEMREYGRAEQQYSAALALFRSLPNQTPNVLLMLLNLAQLKQDQSDIAAALGLFEDALTRAQEAFPAWHYITLWSHKEYGECLIRAGRFAEAERHLQVSLKGYQESSGDDHVVTRSLRESLASLYDEWGKPALAAESRREASAEAVPVNGSEP